MNKRKRVAWEKHRKKRRKIEAQTRAAKTAPAAGGRTTASA